MASTDNDVGSTGSRRGTSSQEPDETTCVAMKTTGDQGRCTNTKQTATKAFLRAGKSFDGPDVLKNMCAQHAKMYQRSPADVKFCREYSAGRIDEELVASPRAQVVASPRAQVVASPRAQVVASPRAQVLPTAEAEHPETEEVRNPLNDGPGWLSRFMEVDRQPQSPRRPKEPLHPASNSPRAAPDPQSSRYSFSSFIPDYSTQDNQPLLQAITEQEQIITRIFEDTQSQLARSVRSQEAHFEQATRDRVALADAIIRLGDRVDGLGDRLDGLGLFCGQQEGNEGGPSAASRAVEMQLKDLAADLHEINKREDDHYRTILRVMAGHSARVENAVQNAQPTKDPSDQRRKQVMAKIQQQKTALEADTAEWVDVYGDDVKLDQD
ncbi:MAG: hypothetical protein LQ349_002106 [Xanthoria aureola]|nr:MAG: hypothetical protein LQ349_002106 [Xanthoria aureola]